MKLLTKLSLIAAAGLTLAGCKKFVDVNDNLNSATETKAQYVLSGALGNTYRNNTSGVLHIVPGTWVGHYAHSTSFTGGGAEKTYEFTSADFNAFDGLYDNLNDYQYVIDNADKDGVSQWKDPANVMQCFVFQQLVDMYGNVPYTQALKGINVITPKYDDQKVIYEDLVVRLDSAMARMERTTWNTAADVTAQDVYFQGNKTNWIRFANTLKLRILMRQSFMPGRDAYITTNINNTVAKGYITGNVLVSPGYQNIAGKLNPFYANYGYNELNNVVQGHQYRKMNAVLVNWLKTSVLRTVKPPVAGYAATANADTFRLQSLVWPIGTTPTAPSNTLSSYVGIPLGAGSGFATASSSPVGPFQVQQGQGTRAGMLMLLAESFLLQAEAAERYGINFGGTAEQLYNTGVLSHFRTCAAPSTAGNVANAGDAYAIRYLLRPLDCINYAVSPDKIKAILLQKWVSLVHISGLEAWSEYRKASGTSSVGVPSPVATVAGTSNPEPVRYLYPQSEQDANANQVPKGIDRFTSKIFWDVN